MVQERKINRNVYTRHSPSPTLPCPCLSWPALPCPGPSWQGYHTKLTVVPPHHHPQLSVLLLLLMGSGLLKVSLNTGESLLAKPKLNFLC